MDRSFLRSPPVVIAIPLALAAAVVYFGVAPLPPETMLNDSRGRGARGWFDWRTPAFYEMSDRLDRSDPVQTTFSAFEALRRFDYACFLAHFDNRRQLRHTPESVRSLIGVSALTLWDTIEHVDTYDRARARVVVLQPSSGDNAIRYAATLVPDEHGWSMIQLRRWREPVEDPAPQPAEAGPAT